MTNSTNPAAFQTNSTSPSPNFPKADLNTFYGRRIEELKDGKIDQLKQYTILTKVAAAVSVIAFLTFCTVTFISVGLLVAPIYTSLVAVGASTLVPVVSKLFVHLKHQWDKAEFLSSHIKGIQEKFNEVNQRYKGINRYALPLLEPDSWHRRTDEEVEQAKPLLAHYEYWKEIAFQTENEIDKLQSEAKDNPSNEDNKQLLALKNGLLEAKTRAAFLDRILKQRDFTTFKGSAKDVFNICRLSTNTLKKLKKDKKEIEEFQVVRFKADEVPPLTAKDLKNLSIDSISEKMKQTMVAQAAKKAANAVA